METKITEDHFIEFMATDFPSFKVTKCNLAYPTSDFVTSFYTLMIDAMTGTNNSDQLWNLTEEQCILVQANQVEGNSFINHIHSRNLHAAVKYIINQVNPNVPEFSYSDILLPENTPRRTFVFMSFMLNCFYYFISFSENLHEEMVACEEKGKEIRRKRDLKEELLNQLKELEDKRAEDVESLKHIKTNILKLTASNKEKENILKELHSKNDLIDSELRMCEEKERNLQDELTKLENSVSHFKSLIVQNPNEAAEIHAINEMKKLECKEKMKNLEEQVRISSSQLAKFNKVSELQQTLNNILLKTDDFSTGMSKDFKELQISINELNMKLSNLKISESKITNQFAEKELLVPKLQSESTQLESDQAAIICKGEERYRIHKQYIENQEKSCIQTSIKMKKDIEDIGDIQAHILECNEKCLEVQEKIKAVNSETKTNYFWCINEIKTSFTAVHNALASKCELLVKHKSAV